MTRLLPVLLVALAIPGLAQQAPPSAPGAYDQAAKLFIDGDNAQAEAVAEEGLRAAPSDAKLQALLDLIRQQQPPQDGGGGDQNEDEQNQPQDPSDEGESGSEGQQQDAPPDERQEAEQDQTRTDPQDSEGEENESDPQRPERTQPGEEGDASPRPVPDGQMSAEQAERLLEAVGGEERLLLRELRRRPSRMRRTDKDW